MLFQSDTDSDYIQIQINRSPNQSRKGSMTVSIHQETNSEHLRLRVQDDRPLNTNMIMNYK